MTARRRNPQARQRVGQKRQAAAPCPCHEPRAPRRRSRTCPRPPARACRWPRMCAHAVARPWRPSAARTARRGQASAKASDVSCAKGPQPASNSPATATVGREGLVKLEVHLHRTRQIPAPTRGHRLAFATTTRRIRPRTERGQARIARRLAGEGEVGRPGSRKRHLPEAAHVVAIRLHLVDGLRRAKSLQPQRPVARKHDKRHARRLRFQHGGIVVCCRTAARRESSQRVERTYCPVERAAGANRQGAEYEPLSVDVNLSNT